MTRPAKVHVDTTAILDNYRLAKRLHPQAQAVAVVKANAYGHGAVPVSQALAAEADAFGVACLEEALELRQAGITNPIVLLEGFFQGAELADIVDHDLSACIHTQRQLDMLCQASLPKPINVWLKLDTGMHRLGFNPSEFKQAYARLQNNANVNTLVLMSHFACADDLDSAMTQQQLEVFKQATRGMDNPVSLANSPSVLAWPETGADWIRPGMMLYGASPLLQQNAASEQLKPAMTLASAVIAVKDVAAGSSVGYGATYSCAKPSRIAVVAMGYGDGYPRTAQNGTPVLVNGQRCKLAGRVSMDMLTVDVSTLDDVKIGDPVIFWGPGLPAHEVAPFCNTIAYELTTRLTQRPPRTYD